MRSYFDLPAHETLEKLIEIGVSLSTERRLNELLKRIVTEARNFARCDAGSLYIKEGGTLKFVVSQCESLDSDISHTIARSLYVGGGVPITEDSIAGYVALKKTIERIDDAYNLPPDKPYTHSKVFDLQNNYHTGSILSFPLLTPDGGVVGVLQLINHIVSGRHFGPFPESVVPMVRSLASQAAVAIANMQLTEQLKNIHFDTIIRLSSAAEFRDNETANHVRRVSAYSEMLARQLGLDVDLCERIRAASPLHDIGKIGIPDGILRKPGKLTDEEYLVMRTHARIGAKIMSGSGSALLQMCERIAATHHEKWDGSGYPEKLSGEQIPIEGRIVALADVFDALISRRVYKEPMPIDKVVDIIRAESGKHFDPAVIDAFWVVLPQLREIHDQLRDE
jgi:HD-GYP domain-containing protein (c-di-GMP phosphodiesterase class II)